MQQETSSSKNSHDPKRRKGNMSKQQSSPVLLREDRGAVAILTLNRPDKLNALSNELIAGIMNALNSIELDSSVRVVVITGAGRAFSAGADIAAFHKHMQAGPADAIMHFMRPGHQMTRRVESYPKPIILKKAVTVRPEQESPHLLTTVIG
ncbi:enoyl-CoA hydratase/isomerase family protein [Acidithiobacillus ferrivorans]|uniref:enoyl-CoA hydratase/isomerase family protein n=2 Tax=Acidithiobacillus ferrivorans TaxID=160808 RepID=UPI003521BCCD